MNVVGLVRKLESGVNDGDVDGVIELFDEKASVVIPALSPKSGIDEVRTLFEFCAGINVRWDFEEITPTDVGADCRVDQYDGWADLIGISPLRYAAFTVVASEDRILAIEGTWSPETLDALGRSLEGFTPWATTERPELYADDGDFVYSRRSGEGFIAAAAEWLAAS